MKKLFIAICMALLLVPAAYSADLKIGVVAFDRVQSEAPQVKAFSDAMEKRFGNKKKELQDMEAELKTLQDNYKRNELVMTQDKLDEMKNTMTGKYQQYKQQEATLVQEVNTMRSQESATFRDTVQAVIKTIAEDGKYDLILGDGVAYGAPALDITDKVLAGLKKAAAAEKK